MKELNRIHLNGLRAVEAVLRHGSLAGAAEELGVTIGAVSQQIKRCEAQLGRPFFERGTRGLAPNRFGREIAPQLREAFDTLERAVRRATRIDDHTLTISVAPVFAAKWLVPRLARFSALHPGIQLRLDANTALVNPDRSDIDLGIRVGEGPWEDVHAERLLPQETFPVCAPALAGRLHHPRDLLSVPVVRDANSNLHWQDWLAMFGLDEKDMRPGNSFTDAALCLDAAIAGQGVMLAWQTLAHDALSTGLLVAPFPQRVTTKNSYWLITSRERHESRQLRLFKNWLRQQVEEDFCASEPV